MPLVERSMNFLHFFMSSAMDVLVPPEPSCDWLTALCAPEAFLNLLLRTNVFWSQNTQSGFETLDF